MRLGFLISVYFLIQLGAAEWIPDIPGRIAHISAPKIRESSGLAASTRHPGIIWTLNDSGNDAEIYAIRDNGNLVTAYEITDTKNRDWEDLALHNGQLYIADVGDNDQHRTNCEILVVDEPENLQASMILTVQKRIPVHYPDGPRDCESFFIDSVGNLHLLSKDKLGGDLYRLDGTNWKQLQRLDLGYYPTGADLHKGRLAISSYVGWFIFEKSGQHIWQEQQRCLSFVRSCEAITWENDKLIISNEDRDLFRFTPEDHPSTINLIKSPPWPFTREEAVIKPFTNKIKPGPVTITIATTDGGKASSIRCQVPNRSSGRIMLGFSIADGRGSLALNANVTWLNLQRTKSGEWKASWKDHAGNPLLQTAIIFSFTKRSKNAVTIQLPTAFIDQWQSFGLYTKGFGGKSCGWPYSYHRSRDNTAFWCHR